MSRAPDFLHAFAQSLSALSLYPEGHSSRERALDMVFEKLRDLLDEDPNPQFSFLEGEVIYGKIPLKELRNWEWSDRLADVGIQRLNFDRSVTREELEAFLDESLARLTLHFVDTSTARPTRPSGISFGAVGIAGEESTESEEQQLIETAGLTFSLGAEAETVDWMHQELSQGGGLNLAEAETVVQALSVTMRGDQQLFLPLVELREFDEYTTTHSLNVSTLTMGLAEWLGFGARDVRAFGVAGLMHDLGKVKVPEEVLNKRGKLDRRERELMNAHPAEGAKIIITTHSDLDMAAVVAYEHHIMLNGGGYPRFKYRRECHQASKLVHVCDVYDALRTNRPYRRAWPSEKVLAYLEERSGIEFDGQIAHAFTSMMREWEPKPASIRDDGGPTD